MSFQWIPCTDLTGPKWNYSLADVFEFITKGLLTPFDEAGNPLLPGKFVEVLSKAYSVRHGNRLSWNEARINIERDYDKRRKEYIKGETYFRVTLADIIAAKGHEQASKRALEDKLAEIDEEENRYVSELLEWERFLTEHSDQPWQSISFTPREYEIELEHIAKAFFKEAEVEVLQTGQPSKSGIHGLTSDVPEVKPKATQINLQDVKERNKRIVSEGKMLKKDNPQWKLKQISDEIASNDKIKQRLRIDDMTPGTIERILKGKGIGKQGRPNEPVK